MVSADVFIPGGGDTHSRHIAHRQRVSAELTRAKRSDGPRRIVVCGTEASTSKALSLAHTLDRTVLDLDALGLLDAESLKGEVDEVAEEAGQENWDGEGGRAVSPETVSIAKEVAELLPQGLPKPDINATAHGEVDFDWTIGRGLAFTMSVGPEGDIAFAGLFRGAKLSGTEPWKGVLPGFVRRCLERLQGEAQ